MAKKLSPTEFLDRHLHEVSEVVGLFNKIDEMQYSEIRKKLSLDRKSIINRRSENQPEKEIFDLIIKHETQLMRVLTTLCNAGLMDKKTMEKKVYYHINLSKKSANEIKFRSRILKDPSFINELIESREQLEKQLEKYKNRIFELNLEVGKHINENIELKNRITKLQPNS
jgi:hypothetical protein